MILVYFMPNEVLKLIDVLPRRISMKMETPAPHVKGRTELSSLT